MASIGARRRPRPARLPGFAGLAGLAAVVGVVAGADGSRRGAASRSLGFRDALALDDINGDEVPSRRAGKILKRWLTQVFHFQPGLSTRRLKTNAAPIAANFFSRSRRSRIRDRRSRRARLRSIARPNSRAARGGA